MAQLTYTVTVATGTLYLSGYSGNVFYLNGTRDMDLSWVKSGTLRFEQSDNTNDNHPLFFATQTSNPQSNVLSTGVSYYLDGAVSQSDYFNVSTFNAATTRYVEITPASDSTFYYACYVHGIGMGGEIDITQNTWGALSWNVGHWGDQTDVTIESTSFQLTSAIGDEIAFPDRGWGGNTWSHGNWGEVNQTDIRVSGLQLQSSIGEEVAFPDRGWGGNTWSHGDWGQVNITSVDVTGSQLQTSMGEEIAFPEFGWGGGTWNSNKGGWGNLSEITLDSASFQLNTSDGGSGVVIDGEINTGWGRKTWNNNEGWGIAGTLEANGIQLQTSTPGVSVENEINVGWGRLEWGNGAWNAGYSVVLGSLSLQTSIGEEFPFANFTAEPAGFALQSTISEAHESTADFIATPFGMQLQSSQGIAIGAQDVNPNIQSLALATGIGPVEVGALTLVEPSGIQAQINLGEEDLAGGAIVSPTGIGSAFLLGTADAVSVADPVGIQLQTSASGPQSITGDGLVNLTGIELTASLGSINITPWNEEDLGVNNTWTEVDLAA